MRPAWPYAPARGNSTVITKTPCPGSPCRTRGFWYGLPVPAARTSGEKGPIMKFLILAALAAFAFLALLAGKDDIRRLHRMRAM